MTKSASLVILFTLLVIVALLAITGTFDRIRINYPGQKTGATHAFDFVNGTSVTTSDETLGLSLQLQVTSDSESYGNFNVSAEVMNLRNSSNPVPDMNDWAYPADSLNPNSPCGSPGPVGLGVFRGYYDYSNYSKASTLYLYDVNSTYMCTTIAISNGTLSFFPSSSELQIFQPNYQPGINENAYISDTISNYWSASYSTYRDFEPGVYTLIGADEWGQVVLLHFQVLTALPK